jgi:hypothetical protein
LKTSSESPPATLRCRAACKSSLFSKDQSNHVDRNSTPRTGTAASLLCAGASPIRRAALLHRMTCQYPRKTIASSYCEGAQASTGADQIIEPCTTSASASSRTTNPSRPGDIRPLHPAAQILHVQFSLTLPAAARKTRCGNCSCNKIECRHCDSVATERAFRVPFSPYSTHQLKSYGIFACFLSSQDPVLFTPRAFASSALVAPSRGSARAAPPPARPALPRRTLPATRGALPPAGRRAL